MTKIRKLYYFDKKNAEEMISFLNNSVNDNYINNIMFNPFLPLHYFLPLSLKFLPESFILKDEKEIKGLITVAPSKYGYKRFEIQKLLFEENSLSYQTRFAAHLKKYLYPYRIGSPIKITNLISFSVHLISWIW